MRSLWVAALVTAVLGTIVTETVGHDTSRNSSEGSSKLKHGHWRPIQQERTVVGLCKVNIGKCAAAPFRVHPRHILCPDYKTISVNCSTWGVFEVQTVNTCRYCNRKGGLVIKGVVVDSINATMKLKGITVSVYKTKGKIRTKTDGEFKLTVRSRRNRIPFYFTDKSNTYIRTVKVVDIPGNGFRGPLRVTVAMVRTAVPIVMNASVDNTLSISSDPSNAAAGNATILIKAGTFRRRNGLMYSGNVNASLNFINTGYKNIEAEIPGVFRVGSRVVYPLMTDGIFALTIRAADGSRLKSNPMVVTVPSQMKLWRFNYSGRWRLLKDVREDRRGRRKNKRGRRKNIRGRSKNKRGRRKKKRGRSKGKRGRSKNKRGRSKSKRGQSKSKRERNKNKRGQSKNNRGRNKSKLGRRKNKHGSRKNKRGRRQASKREFLVAIKDGRWINIAKIPKTPICYYKTRIFNENSGTEIVNDLPTVFRPDILAFRVAQSQRLQLYAPYTVSPAAKCFEARCPTDSADPIAGLIRMTSYENVLVNGTFIPIVQKLRPKELTQYSSAIQKAHGLVQYKIAPNLQEVFVNFLSNETGPFYTKQSACVNSDDSQPAFHFFKPELPPYLAYPDDVEECTARVHFTAGSHFTNAIANYTGPPIAIAAISAWTQTGNNHFFTSNTAMQFSSNGGAFYFACLTYRCSKPNEPTTLHVDIDVPMVPGTNGTVVPLFTCIDEGNIQTGAVEGSVVAPETVGNGTDYYGSSPNDCRIRAKNETFAIVFKCFRDHQ